MKQTLRDFLCPQPKSKIKAGDGQLKGAYNFYTSSQIQSKFYHSATYTQPALIFGTGGMASVHYCNEPFSTSTDCLVMYGRLGAPLELIYYYLRSNMHLLQDGFKGAGLQHISKDYILNININMPAPSLQEQITHQMRLIDAMINGKKQQILSFDEAVKSRFIELFGTETEFDKWPCCTIGDVADVCVGVVIKPTQYYTDKGIPAFRSLNIGEMHVKDSDWVYFTEEGHQKNQKSVVHKNDVLVVRSGAPGIACVATEKYDGYNAVDIIIAHPDNSKVNSIFLAAFTNMPHGMNQIRERTGGAAQQHFNVGGYKAMRLIMPSIELQNQYAVFVEQTDKSKLAVKQSLEKLETLKKSLMQQYFG